jgi:hypothetical protein
VSRLSALVAHPRRTLGALAVVLAAVGITVGSGADFTAQSANPSNTFSTGTLSIGNTTGTGSANAILTAANLKPGGTSTGTVDIANSGSLAGTFTVSGAVSDTKGTGLSSALQLTVDDCGLFSGATAPTCATKTSVYSGTLSGFPAAASPKTLGSFAAGDKHRYQFTVTLPSTGGAGAGADNALQDTASSASFTWKSAS